MAGEPMVHDVFPVLVHSIQGQSESMHARRTKQALASRANVSRLAGSSRGQQVPGGAAGAVER